MTGRREEQWRARPVLAGLVRSVLMAVPMVASGLSVWAVAWALPDGAVRTWWGLTAMLVVAVVVAVVVERAARRLLPLAVLLKLSMVFPDRAPSRLKLTRAAAVRVPKPELIWNSNRPTTTSDLVVNLVAALGAHDRRTRGHSERVRVLCDMLAEELDLDGDARDRLRWAALLHDVGKMTVSTSILNKPSRLDEKEFDRIRRHPQAGAELAAPLLPWLGEWGDGILDHHEKYDGTGYPNGSVGTDISLAGRLIGVVDAFETMTAARAYKKAMATKAAREELARCAGTHFDPVLVRAFLSISLPRVLWAMGPVSFLLQIPFLRPLAQAGARSGAITSQAAAVTAGAAGAAVLATSGAVAVGDATGYLDLGTERAALTAPAAAESDAGSTPETAAPGTADDAGTTQLAAPVDAGDGSSTTALTSPATRSSSPAGGTSAAPAVRPVTKVPAARPRPGAATDEDPAPTSPTDPTDPVDPSEPTGPTDPTDPTQPTDPGTTDPGTTDPGTTDPGTTDPGTTDPGTTDPGTTDPGTGTTGVVIVEGPAATTSETTATFVLRDVTGVTWECQLPRNATGESSRWVECSGTLVVELVRDGQNTLKIRDAVTKEQVDSWTWTVTTTEVSGRALPAGLVDLDAAAAPDDDGSPTHPLLPVLVAAGLPFALVVRQMRRRT